MKKSNGIVFILLIPIIFIILAFAYDNIMIIIENKGYEEITNSIIKEALTNSYSDKEARVKQAFEEKKLETEQLSVSYEDNVLYVYNVHLYPSFFGKAVGVKSYRTEVDLKGYQKEDKIIIEKNGE